MAVEKMEREKKELQKDKDELQSTLQVNDSFSLHVQNLVAGLLSNPIC
jgi:hypothetical protein